jgi:hypothetical protein
LINWQKNLLNIIINQINYNKSDKKVSDVHIDCVYDLDDDEFVDMLDIKDRIIIGSIENRFYESSNANNNIYYNDSLNNVLYFKIDVDNFGNCIATIKNNSQIFTIYVIVNNKKLCETSFYFFQNRWNDNEPYYVYTEHDVTYIMCYGRIGYQIHGIYINDFNNIDSKYELVKLVCFLISDFDVTEHIEFSELIEEFCKASINHVTNI